jgi:hypothetical protein
MTKFSQISLLYSVPKSMHSLADLALIPFQSLPFAMHDTETQRLMHLRRLGDCFCNIDTSLPQLACFWLKQVKCPLRFLCTKKHPVTGVSQPALILYSEQDWQQCCG